MSSKKRTLTVDQVLDLHKALSELDGRMKAVELAAGKSALIVEPYALSGKTRWNINKNLRVTKRVADDFEKTRVAKVREISKAEAINQKSPKQVKAFEAAMKEVLAIEEDVSGLLNIAVSELLADGNNIPQSVLKGLEPILTDDMDQP